MIDWYTKRNWLPIRQALNAIRGTAHSDYQSEISDAIAFFNRSRDTELLSKAMVHRFGTTMVEDPEDKSIKYYRRSMDSSAIETRFIEKINTGFGSRVIWSLANLGSEPDQSWQFVDRKSKAQNNIDKVSELIQEVREQGKFSTTFIELDAVSVMVESSFFHIYHDGEKIAYDVVTPDKIWIKFGQKITMRGGGAEDSTRWVDYRKLDDASAVIVLMQEGSAREAAYSGVDSDLNVYLAYVGACDSHIDGRFVAYQGRAPWPIPDVGSPSILDENMVGGEPCNPLTWLLHYGEASDRELVTTEYPFVIFRGGHRIVTDGLMPTTVSLYEDCLELEIAFSRLLRAALSGARGRDLIRLGQAQHKLPKNLDIVVMDEGDDFQNIGWPAAHARDGMDVVLRLVEQTSGGYCVPGYMVVGQLGGMNPPSGVALALQTQPLIRFRNHRTKLNQDAVRGIFDIERAMLRIHYPRDTRGLLKGNITQLWNPGEWQVPDTPLEEIQATTQEMDAKLVDYVGAIQRRYRLASEADAISLIEKMDARDPEFKSPLAVPEEPMVSGAPIATEDNNTDEEALSGEEEEKTDGESDTESSRGRSRVD